jgi:hypothetical protein
MNKERASVPIILTGSQVDISRGMLLALKMEVCYTDGFFM